MACDVLVFADQLRIWKLVSNIAVPTLFSPELQRVEWLNGADRPALGHCFVGYNTHPTLGSWRTISRIVELKSQRAFGWSVVDPDDRFGGGAPNPARPMTVWRFRMEREIGGVRLWESMRIGPSRSGLSLAIDRWPEREEALVAKRLEDLRDGIMATLAGMKSLAEEER